MCERLSPQPSYPVVLPVWYTECCESFVISLVEELNVSDEASSSASHPVSPPTSLLPWHVVN